MKYKFIDDVELWLSTLETTDKNQGIGSLRVVSAGGTEKFCCLGIACDLFIPDKVDSYTTNNGVTRFTYEGWDSVPPQELNKRLGIKSVASFWKRNDDSGMTFKEIAAAAREEPYIFFDDHVYSVVK